MCCCTVVQCCCGCTHIKTGIIIWAVVDIVINVVFGGANIGVGNFAGVWCIIMLVMDILLAIGAHTGNTCLMIFWQVFMMIHIVGLFIMWLAIPILVFGASVASEVSALCDDPNYHCEETATSWLDAYIGIAIVGMVIIVILPIIYIYWFIVVNSYRKQLVMERLQTMPMVAVAPVYTGQPMMMAQPVMMQQPQPAFGTVEKY